MQVRFLDREDLLEERIATHSSILAWRIPWTEESGRLQSMGLQRVRHDAYMSVCLSINRVTSSYVGFLRSSKTQFESWGKGSSCLLFLSIPLGIFRKAGSSLSESKELPLGFTHDWLFQKFVYVRNFPVLQAVFLKRLVACSSAT